MSDGVSNHRRFECLLKSLFRRRSKKTSKHPVTGICEGNPPLTGGFPSQSTSNAENISIQWRNHGDCSDAILRDICKQHTNSQQQQQRARSAQNFSVVLTREEFMLPLYYWIKYFVNILYIRTVLNFGTGMLKLGRLPGVYWLTKLIASEFFLNSNRLWCDFTEKLHSNLRYHMPASMVTILSLMQRSS